MRTIGAKYVKFRTNYDFSDQISKQSWSEVYKSCISDRKFWAETPWSEVHKNYIPDQNSLVRNDQNSLVRNDQNF